jgi:hypothetical protein
MAVAASEREWYATALIGKPVSIPAAAFENKWKNSKTREQDKVPVIFEGMINAYIAGKNRAQDKWDVDFAWDNSAISLKLDLLQSYMKDAFPMFVRPAVQGPKYILSITDTQLLGLLCPKFKIGPETLGATQWTLLNEKADSALQRCV